jgi:hypothetical protein|tara:strand:+ start:138 stop:584 length:447 start_codon:yes stop_codon:yes gene_type:complete
MKKLILAFCMLLNFSAATSAEDYPISKYGFMFTDHSQGITLEMAVFKEKNDDGLHDVLLKFTGMPAEQDGIDGKVIRYKTIHAGSGQNFQYEEGDKWFNRMITRQGWGSWEIFEVYFGNNSYNLRKENGNHVMPYHLYSAYLKQQKDQ